ncbi:MAG: hypothetical protein ACREKL_17080 [Chthoniobacterales bacterium]
MSAPAKIIALLLLAALALAAMPARAALISMSASGTISFNSSADTTLPIGTPWTFELIYNTAAPDLDFESGGSADPTVGRFTNTGAIPALTFFHYHAGSYDVTIDDPADFGTFSSIEITFLGAVHAIDINILNSAVFPTLAGEPVTFHADFNDGSHSSLSSDALPTNPAIGIGNFQGSSVSLLPTHGVVSSSQPDITSLTFTAVPEPPATALFVAGILVSLTLGRRAFRKMRGMPSPHNK